MIQRFTIFLITSMFLSLNSQEYSTSRGYLYYTTGKGIGYKKGYTTVEIFNSYLQNSSIFPYINLRGHFFNDGKFAANAGGGFRYIGKNRIYGVNGYYDYRQTKNKDYQQVAFGVESLGYNWDLRIYGYLPLGNHSSSARNPEFSHFDQNQLYISVEKDFSLGGASGEIGGSIFANYFDCIKPYIAAGTYYLNGKEKSTWGGEGRLYFDIYKYFWAEVKVSHDGIYNTLAQGRFGLQFPLGRKTRNCCICPTLRQRATQRPERHEIIPTSKKTVDKVAVNSLTNEPYSFVFVNNLSSKSLGTFAFPFLTLQEAEAASKDGDIIYVFPGDGTSTGMDMGIDLKDNQKLLGSAVSCVLPSTCGSFVLPALTQNRPDVSLPKGIAIVAANNNEIAGLFICDLDVEGIEAQNINNLLVRDNIIDSFSTDLFPSIESIDLENCTGLIRIINNTFLLENFNSPMFGIRFVKTLPNSTFQILNNTFLSEPGSIAVTGIEFGETFDGPPTRVEDFESITIEGNTFDGMGNIAFNAAKAIGGFGFNGSGDLFLKNNIFTRCYGKPPRPYNSIVGIRVGEDANLNITVDNNIWENSISPATVRSITIQNQADTSICNVSLINNISDSTGVGYRLDNTVGGTFNAVVENNIGTVNEININ